MAEGRRIAPDQSVRDAVVCNTQQDQFLSASAGSGKTSTLVDHYLHLLETGEARPQEIVAVTFTEKAAGELKERVRRKCRDRAEEEDGGRWEVLSRELETAPIGTIHGLCSRILRESALAARLDPAFAVLDETEGSLLLERCVRGALLERLDAEEESAVALVFAYGLKRAAAAICALAEARAALGEELARDRYDNAGVLLEAWREQCEPVLEALMGGLCTSDQWRQCAATLRGSVAADPSDKLELARRAALGCIDRYESAVGTGCIDTTVEALQALRSVKSASNAGRAQNWEGADAVAAVRKALSALGTQKGELRLCADEVMEWLEQPEDADAAALTCALVAETRVALARLEEAKRQAQALDFEDLLLRVRDLWRTQPEALKRFQQRYSHVMIDEFQDTNDLQKEILWSLAGRQEEGCVPTARLFVVGDAKQSIYRFRDADVSVFNRTEVELRSGGQSHELFAGFRTTDGLTAFVNAVFSDPAMMGTYEDRPEWEARYRCVDAVRERPDPERVQDVEIAVIYDAEDPAEGGEEAEGVEDQSIKETEADWIAGRIRRMWEEQWPVGVTGAEGQAGCRPVQFGDVAILLRSFGDIALYERSLRAAGVPYYVLAGRGFYQAQEVRDVLACLSALENTLDEVSLVGALRSPLFGVSDETLFWLSQARGTWWERVQGGGDQQIAKEERAKLQRAAEVLGELREVENLLMLSELVGRVYELTGLPAVLAAQYGGAQKVLNLQKLQDLASDYEAQGGSGLRGFVSYVRELDVREERESEAPVEEEHGQSVKLLTIHKAKGLEWPVVFVPDLARQLPSDSELFRRHPAWGVVCSVPGGESTYWPRAGVGARKAIDAEEEAERRRVLYVATTRARDLLVLSAAVRLSKDGEWGKAASAGCLGWLDAALGGRLRGTVAGSEALEGEDWCGVLEVVRGAAAGSAEGTAGAARPLISMLVPETYSVPREAEAPPLPALVRPWQARPGQAAARRYTATELAEYLADPARYRERYVCGVPDQALKVPGVEAAGLSAAERGEVVHHLLRLVGTGGEAALEQALAEGLGVDAALAVRLEGDLEGILATVRAYVRSEAYLELIAPAARLRTEAPVSFMLEEAMIEGKLDALVEGEGGALHLLDYKTGHRVEAYEGGYRFQLGLYCLGVECATGRPPASAGIVYLGEGGPTVVALVPGEAAEEARAAAGEAIRGIEG